jgi:t-SNARE complex subunit (syntaxin)
MSDPNSEDAAAAKARRGRNLLLAVALVAFVILIFVVTIVKISHNVAHTG